MEGKIDIIFSEVKVLDNRLSISTLPARVHCPDSGPKIGWGGGDRKTWGVVKFRDGVGVRWLAVSQR